MNSMKLHAPNVLRIGISLVIMWFGFQQLLHPVLWTGFLPDFTNSLPISQIGFIYLNGAFEVFAAALIIMGLFIRTFSALLALHLIGIVFTLGYTAVSMRDLGLVVALISIFMQGTDSWYIVNNSEKVGNSNTISN